MTTLGGQKAFQQLSCSFAVKVLRLQNVHRSPLPAPGGLFAGLSSKVECVGAGMRLERLVLLVYPGT